MMSMCKDEGQGCAECLQYNTGRVGFHPITPLTATLPMDHICWDFFGPFKTSERGYNIVLLIVDIATRFVILRAMQTKTAEEVAMTLLEVFSNFGFPKIVQHDNDPSFRNKVMDRLREVSNYDVREIMKYFPNQNGAPERYVGKVKRLLKKKWRGDYTDWDLWIPVMQIAVNDRVIGRHLSSPFSCMFARKLNTCRDYREVISDPASMDELFERNKKMVEAVYPQLEERSRAAGKKYSDAHNKEMETKRKKLGPLKNGTKVMKMVDVRSSKLEQRWEGPFTVVDYDKSIKGYQLLDVTGGLLKGKVPISRMRIIDDLKSEEDDEFYEIEEVEEHRGPTGSREYLVKWKGYEEKTWVKEDQFLSHNTIKDYWAGQKKAKPKEKSKEKCPVQGRKRHH